MYARHCARPQDSSLNKETSTVSAPLKSYILKGKQI